jgi:hemoglobin
VSQEAAPSNATPYALLGGADAVRRLVDHFYDVMEQREPELAALHRRDDNGRISEEFRGRFALFLIGWLGGPQEYTERHGHPRLRMRHGHVPVDQAMQQAWLRCMSAAMDTEQITGPVRGFLDRRFAEVAEFLRNVAE